MDIYQVLKNDTIVHWPVLIWKKTFLTSASTAVILIVKWPSFMMLKTNRKSNFQNPETRWKPNIFNSPWNTVPIGSFTTAVGAYSLVNRFRFSSSPCHNSIFTQSWQDSSAEIIEFKWSEMLTSAERVKG